MVVRHSSPFFWHPKSGYVLVIDAPPADRLLLERLRSEGISGAERFFYFDTEAAARGYLDDILAGKIERLKD
jgi:hypothetical protein